MGRTGFNKYPTKENHNRYLSNGTFSFGCAFIPISQVERKIFFNIKFYNKLKLLRKIICKRRGEMPYKKILSLASFFDYYFNYHRLCY